jgi:hypothetical protein
MKRTPLKRSAPPKRTRLKQSKPAPLPQWVKDWWEWVRAQPCLICGLFSPSWIKFPTEAVGIQLSQTEVAHVGPRGLRQKYDPREVLPLCGVLHHRLGPYSAHRLGKRFWEFHELDREALLREYWERYEVARGFPKGLFSLTSSQIPDETNSERSTVEGIT